MDFFLSRYRHLTVLLIVIASQLVLIAYQVKTNNDIPLIRVWAVTAVTPVEQSLEFVRRYTWGFVEDYFVLLGVRSQNEKLQRENGQLKIENNYLKSELSTADHAQALSVFQARSPSKTVAARVIGNGTGANSRVVFVDRGSTSGVESGMAVVTPDGIVGKVVDAYPTSSLVMLITDPTFAAGVVSQKNRVHGTLKGLGHSECLVDYVQNEEHVDIGEWFYTSGDDRIFPKGFPVGQVTAAPNGKTFKEIYISPSGTQGGVEAVLIVLQGVHQEVPGGEIASPAYTILPAPTQAAAQTPEGAPQPGALATDADRLRAIYKDVGAEQKHTFGEGPPGTKPPDFTKIPSLHGAPAPNAAAPPATAQTRPLAGPTQPATAPPGPAQPGVAKPSEAKAVAPNSAAPVVVKPKPVKSAPADEEPDENGDEPAAVTTTTAQPAGPAARKSAPMFPVRPRGPASNSAPASNPAPATNRPLINQ
jgi:rod shape-determining protein MreC